jgi:thiol-disulfide isomerase/thioredoxin
VYETFDGKWKAMFRVETPEPYPAQVVLKQREETVTGTILTETGDYRFLDGSVIEDRLYLSTFDGSHAYLFEAKLLEDGTLSGVYRSGNHFKTYWTAARNDSSFLSDPYSLTNLADETTAVSFRLLSTDGDSISLDDPKYTGKPKLVTIFGTWCPNCMDENKFLLDYLEAHPGLDIQIFSIAFERHKDQMRAMDVLRRYKQEFQIPWEVLYGGYSDKQYVTEVLPVLKNFVSFPTMIFLDKDNNVVKIHTGFYGPATEKYVKFKEDFDAMIKALVAKSSTG